MTTIAWISLFRERVWNGQARLLERTSRQVQSSQRKPLTTLIIITKASPLQRITVVSLKNAKQLALSHQKTPPVSVYYLSTAFSLRVARDTYLNLKLLTSSFWQQIVECCHQHRLLNCAGECLNIAQSLFAKHFPIVCTALIPYALGCIITWRLGLRPRSSFRILCYGGQRRMARRKWLGHYNNLLILAVISKSLYVDMQRHLQDDSDGSSSLDTTYCALKRLKT